MAGPARLHAALIAGATILPGVPQIHALLIAHVAHARLDRLDGTWLRTGDPGRIDAAGRLHIVGRAKALIIRRGFNVYPQEVEAALNDHPDVIQCAVIGRRRDGGEDVLAFVQCRDPASFDTAALAHFAAARLSGYKWCTHILAVDTRPAAPTGKILKHGLLDVFADRLKTGDQDDGEGHERDGTGPWAV